MAEKAAETEEAVIEGTAETVAKEMAENVTEEMAETEIVTVKLAERQRPRRWSRGRDQGLDILANKGPPPMTESVENFKIFFYPFPPF